jgi:hypothetical protein
MEKLRTVIGNLLGAVSIAVGLWIATQDKVSAATACLSTGILILLIANINHFEFIKGFGFEARTKKLDEKIEEADRLLNQLKLTSQLFADISVQLMSRAGRFGGPIPKGETQDLLQRLRSLLESLGVKQADIDNSLDPFHRITLRDLSMPCFNRLFGELQNRVQAISDAMGQWTKTHSPINPSDPEFLRLNGQLQVVQNHAEETRRRFEEGDPFTLDKLLEKAVADAPSWSDSDRRVFLASIKQLLHEYQFYAKNKRINDLPAWLAKEYGH